MVFLVVVVLVDAILFFLAPSLVRIDHVFRFQKGLLYTRKQIGSYKGASMITNSIFLMENSEIIPDMLR